MPSLGAIQMIPRDASQGTGYPSSLKNHAIPYGMLGFLGDLLAVYIFFCVSCHRSPIFPWMKLRGRRWGLWMAAIQGVCCEGLLLYELFRFRFTAEVVLIHCARLFYVFFFACGVWGGVDKNMKKGEDKADPERLGGDGTEKKDEGAVDGHEEDLTEKGSVSVDLDEKTSKDGCRFGDKRERDSQTFRLSIDTCVEVHDTPAGVEDEKPVEKATVDEITTITTTSTDTAANITPPAANPTSSPPTPSTTTTDKEKSDQAIMLTLAIITTTLQTAGTFLLLIRLDTSPSTSERSIYALVMLAIATGILGLVFLGSLLSRCIVLSKYHNFNPDIATPEERAKREKAMSGNGPMAVLFPLIFLGMVAVWVGDWGVGIAAGNLWGILGPDSVYGSEAVAMDVVVRYWVYFGASKLTLFVF
ncbi:hypothetical protein QBC47DRAFT_366700 [Echria macrotheca]|uniref:Uncharacterized protein n=1 Tax=Echria macrotheca TaxID=438768 RepID=A0AAJ0BL26_9PEZI|nr:hypothetical protein QBC47DRAFT_366700 [Echria macrotheca]